LTLQREECASGSEWKKGNRNEFKVSSKVTAAQEVHSEIRRELRSANVGDGGDMCEVKISCGRAGFHEGCLGLHALPVATASVGAI
jgi:hypothetical protein